MDNITSYFNNKNYRFLAPYTNRIENYEKERYLYIHSSSTHHGVTLFNSRNLMNRYNMPSSKFSKLDDITIRKFYNIESLELIDNKFIDYCLKNGIKFFKSNDKEICVSYFIRTIDGLVGIPIISINDIRCKKRINQSVLTSKVFRKIKTNKVFTTYVCLRLLKNLDIFLIKEIIAYNSYN